MRILKIISTMNKTSIEDLNLEEKNIFKDILIINQITDNLILNKKIINKDKKYNYAKF